jgi:ABC-type multidrug transport system fused ATPase/permease subunit
LRFSYSHSDSFSIRDVNLDIKPGESIAIVGKTGSGKSTLADLILGVLVPSSGSVRISGLDPNVVFKKWPGKIGYVPQTITFFNGTVRENVALGFEKSEVDDIQVRWCLRQVLLETFFDQREGLDTVIGERGIFLSGGQRQRLGIARALYNKPDIIILDEATSALDAETELTISKTIRELSGKKTLLVIAHRLATVQQLDRIAYMKDGQIESVGTFVEVRSKVPDFESQLRISGLQGN